MYSKGISWLLLQYYVSRWFFSIVHVVLFLWISLVKKWRCCIQGNIGEHFERWFFIILVAVVVLLFLKNILWRTIDYRPTIPQYIKLISATLRLYYNVVVGVHGKKIADWVIYTRPLFKLIKIFNVTSLPHIHICPTLRQLAWDISQCI